MPVALGSFFSNFFSFLFVLVTGALARCPCSAPGFEGDSDERNAGFGKVCRLLPLLRYVKKAMKERKKEKEKERAISGKDWGCLTVALTHFAAHDPC